MKSPFKKWYSNLAYYVMFGSSVLLAILKYYGVLKISWLTVILPTSVAVVIVILMMAVIQAKYFMNPPYFTVNEETFSDFDIVKDKGSEVRPNEGGVLKYDFLNGWFIIYLDGFEAPISNKQNIISYKNN